MINGKKGGWFESWPERTALILLLLGFVISLGEGYTLGNLAIIFLVGLLLGKTLYKRKHGKNFITFLLIFGFLIGFIVGSFRTEWNFIVISLILGSILGFKALQKGWVKLN
ncbi:MAG: hypothetical protein ACQEP1_02405 [Nanobdellota archaeon]